MGNCNRLGNFAAASDPRIAEHPCFSEGAHHLFARMHLAVAPGCNIQCNYCNRKYDCSNESRPGVVSERLKPEQALRKVYHAAERLKELSVIGIAGPGDALANPKRSLKTFRLIKENFPDLKLCVSTNGLALPEHAKELATMGVEHVTVTVNCINPETAAKIYEWVIIDGKKRSDLEAYKIFLARQREGIETLVSNGALVKINSILIPGVNDEELPRLSKEIKAMGAFMHNIMPLISRPEHGTKFGLEGMREPTDGELEDMRERCGDIKQMAHCMQCRADAVGKLGKDVGSELSTASLSELPLPVSNSAKKRDDYRKQIAEFMERQSQLAEKKEKQEGSGSLKVAVCSKNLGIVNQHFGHARRFYVYRVEDGKASLLGVRRVNENYCTGPAECGDADTTLKEIIDTIADCDAVVSLRVGYGPHKRLLERGVLPITELPYLPLEEAALLSAERVEAWKEETGINEREATA